MVNVRMEGEDDDGISIPKYQKQQMKTRKGHKESRIMNDAALRTKESLERLADENRDPNEPKKTT